MATARPADRPGRPPSVAAGGARVGLRARVRPRPSPPRDGAKRCAACGEAEAGGGGGGGGRPACPLCLARRHSGGEERRRRRADPERSGGGPARRDGDGRRELFVCPTLVPKAGDAASGPNMKHKVLVLEERDEVRRRSGLLAKDEPARHDQEPKVLSDSENEEPLARRTRTVSAFVRRTRTWSAFSCGSRRSQSCTDPLEERGGKLKAVSRAAMMDRASTRHSFTAGILLSSENSRSVSAPTVGPDRRSAWRSLTTSAPPALPVLRQERSVSPESNDSISEELNHFKPIVCSPCTPPKRLPDGRLMEPTIVKSTPRNLTRGLQKATSYEASPAVLQKWRQIELDRQSLKVDSKATLTSPVGELHDAGRRDAAAAAAVSSNKRKLVFDAPASDADAFQKQSVKIRVPAVRYGGETTLRGGSDFHPAGAAAELPGALFGRGPAFSPRNSGFQSCRLLPKDASAARKESDRRAASRRGKKSQKTRHLDPDLDADLRRVPARGRDAFDERLLRKIQQERQDRALAVRLQRQFDLEGSASRAGPDTYFLRSWRSNQNRRRRGLRRSRRINKKH